MIISGQFFYSPLTSCYFAKAIPKMTVQFCILYLDRFKYSLDTTAIITSCCCNMSDARKCGPTSDTLLSQVLHVQAGWSNRGKPATPQRRESQKTFSNKEVCECTLFHPFFDSHIPQHSTTLPET